MFLYTQCPLSSETREREELTLLQLSPSTGLLFPIASLLRPEKANLSTLTLFRQIAL